ncbi:glycosyltransferase, partial [Candidatus Saccharibacteria bacterium]|nr:glycosyltransferase [Candidatus Saccharibacteria bacterium]
MTQSSSDKKPLTIVFYTDFFHPSLEGVTASVSLFADALRRLGHRVYVVAPAPARKYHLDHPDVIRLPSMKSVWHKDMRDGIMTPRSAKYIKSLKADIYHFHTNGPTGLGGMRLMFDLHIPSVATYHTDYEQYSKVYPRLWAGLLTGSLIGPMIAKAPVHSWPESLSGMKPKRTFKEWNDNMIHNLIRVSYEFIEHVIVPSEKMARMLRSYGVSRPITILPTGIN